MNFYIGVTDKNWYEYQKAHAFDEVNFKVRRKNSVWCFPGRATAFAIRYIWNGLENPEKP
jgi:hypothetical protein